MCAGVLTPLARAAAIGPSSLAAVPDQAGLAAVAGWPAAGRGRGVAGSRLVQASGRQWARTVEQTAAP